MPIKNEKMETKDRNYIDRGLQHLIEATEAMRSDTAFYLRARTMEPWPVIEAESEYYVKHGADLDKVIELAARLEKELNKLKQ